MKRYILAIVLILLCFNAFGLIAYNGFNNRNHPELKWKRIETTNCSIIYHDPLEIVANQTAKIAQSSFEALSASYHISPKNKCIIYVSDQDNISNGATVFSAYIFIWVNQNDFTAMFTGTDKWVRKVVAHEMSHWFVSTSIQDFLNPIAPISLLSFPHTINEGYAQFFSGEAWGYNRGDRFLKASILSQKQDISSPQYEGGLLYGAGFSMVRYLATVYGEDSLIKLLKYRTKAKTYSFSEAFEHVYHKSFADFEEDWRRYVATYYYGEVYNVKAVVADTTSIGNINDFVKLNTSFSELGQVDWKNDKLLLIGRKTSAQGYADLVLAEVNADSLKNNKLELKHERNIIRCSGLSSMSLSNNGKWVAFSAYTRHKHGRLAPRVFKYNVETRKLRSFKEGNHTEIDTLGGIYYQFLGQHTNDVYYLKPDQSTVKWLSLDFDDQVGNIKLSPDNMKLAVTIFAHTHEFQIVILDVATTQVLHTITLNKMPQSILWKNDLELIYTVENDVDFSLDIVRYNVKNGTQQHFTDYAYNATPVKCFDDQMIVKAEFKRGGAILGIMRPELKPAVSREYVENYYNKWIMIDPLHPISDAMDSIQVSLPVKYCPDSNIKWRGGLAIPTYNSVIGGAVFSEALGKHVIGGAAYLPYSSKDRAWWYFTYINNCFEPTITTTYSRLQWLSGLDENSLFYQDIDELSVNASYPINLQRRFTDANFSMGWKYDKFSNGNGTPNYENMNFSSLVSNLGYGYSLPWKNSELHKVSSYSVNYSLQAATDKIGMNMNFTQQSLQAGFAFAPLLHVANSEMVRTIALENRSTYEFVYGDQLEQLLPGIDRDAILQASNRPTYQRYYLRGYEENHLCKQILNIQNELNIKLTDDLKFGIGWSNSIISTGYVGISLWHDYTVLKEVVNEPQISYTYQANGFEVKVETSLLGIPTVLKYGIAYNNQFEKLSDYFLVDIPLLSSFSSLMGISEK